MASTSFARPANPNGNQEHRRPPKPQFISRRTYRNTLPMPELICPPTFLRLPFQNLERHAKCKITKLEEDYTYEVWPEDILRHCPSLVNMNAFRKPADAKLHPSDAILLEDDFATSNSSKRSQQHSRIVPWMRKTEYISTEYNRFGVNNVMSETKVGFSMKKKLGNQAVMYKDRASQIAFINGTFEKMKQPVKKHYSKKGVYAVEETPILPDQDLYKYSFSQILFDTDPVPHIKNGEEYQKHAILKGLTDQEGRAIVGYFIPTEECLDVKKREEAAGIPCTEGTQYNYGICREYSYDIQKSTDTNPLDTYFFTKKKGAYCYAEMDTRVRLSRRPKTMVAIAKDSQLITSNRELDENDEKLLKMRNNLLYDAWATGQYVKLEDDEEEEEEEQVAETAENKEEEEKEDEKMDENKEEDEEESGSSGSDDSDESSD